MQKEGQELRQNLKLLQEKFKKATNIQIQSYKHDESVYQTISKSVKTIKKCTQNFSLKISQKATFLIGSTGAGKSTLLNYLATSDDNFIVENNNRGIKTKSPPIAEIGSEGSTTLYPNFHELDIGAFLDCAGQGETSGIFIEIINSIIKTKIAQKVSQIKIIIVTSYQSLKGSGSYGQNFKDALIKNSQFMGSINHLKNSVGIVATGAMRNSSAVQYAKERLEEISKHSDLASYKQTMMSVLNHNKISVFSRPEQNAKIGSTYTPPPWNKDQKQVIKKMIKDIPFSSVPCKDFFKVASNPSVRETISKALYVVIKKVANYLENVVLNSIPIKVFTVEIEPAAKFVKELIIGWEGTLSEYVDVLQWNNYLKLKIDKELIAKLEGEMSFLKKLCVEGDQYQVRKNWGVEANLQAVFQDIQSDLSQAKHQSPNNFLNVKSTQTINTVSVSPDNANQIKDRFIQLSQRQEELEKMHVQSKMQDSQYFKNVYKKQLIGTKKQQYKEKEKFVQKVQQQKWKDAEYQKQIVEEKRKRTFTDLQVQDYYDYEQVPVETTKQFQVTQQIKKENPVATAIFGIGTLGFGTLLTAAFTGNPYVTDYVDRTQTYQCQAIQMQRKKVPKQRIVEKQVTQTYTVPTQKLKLVKEGHYETVQKNVLKQKQVIKQKEVPVYGKIIIKQLDQTKYKNRVSQCEKNIAKLKQQIQFFINQYPRQFKEKAINLQIPQIKANNQFEERNIQLLRKWQQAEYRGYLGTNPVQSLQILGLNKIRQKIKNESPHQIERNVMKKQEIQKYEPKKTELISSQLKMKQKQVIKMKPL